MLVHVYQLTWCYVLEDSNTGGSSEPFVSDVMTFLVISKGLFWSKVKKHRQYSIFSIYNWSLTLKSL
jgi:hypothetical protein